MRPTGIVRRIDDLGRIVVPKEIRREMCIRDRYSDEQSGMNLFNKSEIHAAISAVAEEKDKLAPVSYTHL